jgi:hypothetical protein
MHLLYIDDSGAVSDPNQHHFILGGISVFERKGHWIEEKLNEIAARFDEANPYNVELHGSPMRSGRGIWHKVKKADREQAIKDALIEGVQKNGTSVRLFGAVIKKAELQGADPVDHAFEQICSRFDLFLKRIYAKHNDAQRGIMLFDKSTTEERIQTLARDFKHKGHSWGQTKNYAEVPVFLDSRASRLIQLADLIAYAMFRHFEYQDSQYFEIIEPYFDKEGGVNHGLYIRGTNGKAE